MKKTIYTLIALLAIIALVYQSKKLLAARTAEVQSAKPPVALMIQVSTAKPVKGTLVTTQKFLAQIQEKKGIKLSTKLAGTVEKVYVHAGDTVKKGDRLVMLDSAELRSNLQSLRSALVAQEQDYNLTQSTYEANEELYRAGALPKQTLDQSRVGLEAKKAKLEASRQKIAQLEHQLSYLDLTAPFDGQIDAVLLHEGDLAATGRPILSMSDGTKKLVFAYVPTVENRIVPDLPVFSRGMQIGHVRTIYATSQNGLVNAEVALSRPVTLPTGASIDIDVAVATAQGCVLPDDTLIHRADGVELMTYDEKQFSPMKVTVKARSEGKVIVDPCPTHPVARGSEVRLSQLPAYDNVRLSGADHE